MTPSHRPTSTKSPQRSPSPTKTQKKTSPMQTENISQRYRNQTKCIEKSFRHYEHKGYTIRTGYEWHDRAVFELIHPTDVDPHFISYQFNQPNVTVLHLFKNPDIKFYARGYYTDLQKLASNVKQIADPDTIDKYVDIVTKYLIHRVEPATNAM